MQRSDRSELFDRWAEYYDASLLPDNDKFPFAGYGRVLDRVVDLAEVEPGMCILDLGIGTGNLAARFVDKGCAVWGLDFSAEMLARTRAKLPQVILVRADLLEDWSKGLHRIFDRVVSSYVFHEFDLPAKIRLLQEISSHCLSPGGCILVADIAYPGVDARTEASRHERWDEDEYYWAADETITLCEQAGFQVAYEQVSRCGGVFTFKSRG